MAIAATLGTAVMGYAGYSIKKRYDKKEKLIYKKEFLLGASTALAAAGFFLHWHKSYRIIAPKLMVSYKEAPDFIPWSQSKVLWETLRASRFTLWESSLALLSDIAAVLATPLKIFPALCNPIDSAVGSKGLCGSLILPAAASYAYDYLKNSPVNLSYDANLYAPKKDDCKGFSSLVGGVPDLMKQVMTACQATEKEISEHQLRLPKGILFYGPPGTGKTALARAFCEELILKEVKAVFLSCSAAEFKDKWIGGGAKKVQFFFEKARSYAKKGNKVILFIDEIDALAALRTESLYGDKNETINQFLAECDGIDKEANKNIIIMGATNRLDSLDPAIIRGGRLECHIEIPLPKLEIKKTILKSYCEKAGMISQSEEGEQKEDIEAGLIEINIQSYLNKDLSGADIEALVKQAQLIAFDKKENLSLKHIDQAVDQTNKR